MRVGLVVEGRGDLAVLVNLLRGRLGLDFEDIQFIRPEYTLDDTDVHNQDESERGGWVRVKNECVERERVTEFFANAIEEDVLLVIQLDTAEAHEKGYDIARPDPKAATYVEELRQRVVEQVNGWLGGKYTERVRHAVAIEEIDAWVLAIYATKETTSHRDPKRELERVLNRTLSEKERRRLFQLKTYRRYEELTRPFRKLRDLEKHAAKNRSLRLFIDSLPAASDPES